ncbi:MAG: inner-rane translocator [Conexibacter sp.]|nr:inner-rane translocator [Conexibacter sp.]
MSSAATQPAASAPGAASPSDQRGPSPLRDFFKRFAQGELGSVRVIIILAIIWAIFAIANSNFLTSGNLVNLSLQIAATGLISVGVVMVLLLGEIDLSVAQLSGLCAAIMAVLNVQHGWGAVPAIAAAIAAGIALGLFQGFIVTRFGIPSFIVTLAGQIAFLGLLLQVLGTTGTINITDPTLVGIAGTFYTGATAWIIAIVVIGAFAASSLSARRQRVAAGLPAASPPIVLARVALVAIVTLGVTYVLTQDRGVPLALLILVGFVVAFDYIVRRTRYGRHVLAVGGNTEAARRAGIPVTRIRISVFAIAGLMAAIGGIVAASRLLAVNQGTGGSDLLLLSIAGPVIAGTSLFGGRGTVWSALLGGLVIGSVSNGMDLLALSSAIRYMVTGGVLLGAVIIDSIARRQRRAEGRL